MAAPAKLSRRMTSQDASFIYGESHTGPLHIGALSIFNGDIGHGELIEHLAQRMHLLPRYRQRLVFVPFNLAHAAFEDDPDFELHNHVYSHTLPDGTDEKALAEAAAEIFAPMLDRSRPLWEMHLLRGLAGGRSAIVWKIHHCLVDGVSGMELMTTSFDLRADAAPPAPPDHRWEPSPLPSPFRRLADAMTDLARDRLSDVGRAVELLESPLKAARQGTFVAGYTARMARMIARPIAAAPWNSGLVMPARSLAWLTIAFADVRAIRTALGGTVNDVVLTILSEAAARYLAHHKAGINQAPLRIGCPVNVRRASETGVLGNRVSMMFPELPSIPMEATARLQAVIRETERIKAESEPRALDLLLAGSGLLSPTLLGIGSMIATNTIDLFSRMGGAMPSIAGMLTLPPPGINFIATNVPGAQVPLYLSGRRMTEMIGLMPLGVNLGYNVAITSYNQTLVFGMMAEPHLMPDVDLMRASAAEVSLELMAAAKIAASAIKRGDERAGAAAA